ncbi:MAG: LON peptidase substrate-binding domain-containing protein [Planctomycetota bacterium]
MDLDFSNTDLPEPFSGIVRLFPLPNLVVFPGIVQALHMFEERYRAMTRDCLASDQLIAIGFFDRTEVGSEDPLHNDLNPMTCICKIVAHEQIDDGRYNLVVLGIKRARIKRELPVEQPYRMVEVEIAEDELSQSEEQLKPLRHELIEICDAKDVLGKISDHVDIKKIINNELSLGLLVDLISFSGALDCGQKQIILELCDVGQRCEKLIEFLRGIKPDPKDIDFPPKFSAN